MRVLLFQWPDWHEGYLKALAELEKNGHEVVYWVHSKKDVTDFKSAFSKTVFHRHIDAQNMVLPDGLEHYAPPEPHLIEQMSPFESEILTMMNKHYDHMCVDERKRIYYSMLGYWSHVIKKLAPEVIIYIAVPHSVYDFLVYELARIFSIKVVMFDGTLIFGRSLLMTDYKKGSDALISAVEKNMSLERKIGDLAPDIKEHYLEKVGKNPIPVYVKEDKQRYSSWSLLRLKIKIIKTAISEGVLLRRVIGYFDKRFGSNIKKEYMSVQKEPDLTQPFIYMPLNYQPECSTSPEGGRFVDLILAVETLAFALPKGWKLLVKEHPTQWLLRGVNYSSSRYPGYYDRLSRIRGVQLIPVETSSYDLIKRSRAVSSVTGTAAWEAVLMNKPAIIFGYPWYQNYPLLFRVDSVDSCIEAVKKIAGGIKFPESSTLSYLKSLEEGTVPCYFDPYIWEHSKVLSPEKSAQNAMKAILKEISQ